MTQVLCCCDYCDVAVLQFYHDYLSYIKKFTPAEVNHKTQSQRRVMEFGNRLIQRFVDALFDTDVTVTTDGDDIADIWEIAKDSYFCDEQVTVWEKQMKARNLIQ